MKQSPTIRIGDALHRADRFENKDELAEYQFAGTYSYAKGIFVSDRKIGSSFGLPKIQRVRTNDFVYCKIMAWEGAFGLVPPEANDCVLSGAFVAYEIDSSVIEPKFLEYLFKVPSHWKQIGSQSTGTNVRRQSLHPLQFEESRIPCPTIAEQQTIVARLDQLAEKVRQVNEHLDAAEADAGNLLAIQFREAVKNAPLRKMSEVAPAIRRPVQIDISTRYREIGARSFGKGLFVKPDFDGAEATWQKPVWIEEGDLVLSNIKAWEGAIAIAGKEHSGCIASHRYITCVPDENYATTAFLAYFLLSPDGLEKVGFASPGTADRNRTLSLTNLGKIEVPLPPLNIQREFNSLQTKIAELKAKHTKIREANQALIPATLERVFE
jgi:type I restriction enzyme S subunit